MSARNPGHAVLVSRAFDERWGVRVRALCADVALVLVDDDGVEGDPSAVSIAHFSYDLYPDGTRAFADALRQAEGLRWLHSHSAGIDHP